jgi:hypothetical protein
VTLAAAISLLALLAILLIWIQSELGGMDAEICWRITQSDGSLAYPRLQWISTEGGSHITWMTSVPDLRDLKTSDREEPIQSRLTYVRFNAPLFDPALLLRTRTLVGSPYLRGHPRGDSLQIDWNSVCFECFADYWIPFILAIPLPLYWLARRRGWIGRRAAGLCPSCGYDLRASSERCPECGSTVSAASPPASFQRRSASF